MKAKRIFEQQGEQTYVVVFEKNDELMSGLQRFAKEHGLTAARLTAIGALRDVTLGFFDWVHKDYRRISVNEQVEVVSLLGNVALNRQGEPVVHAQVVLGRSDGTTLGGHLLEAVVWPTVEAMVVESPEHLRRKIDEETGLALLDIDSFQD